MPRVRDHYPFHTDYSKETPMHTPRSYRTRLQCQRDEEARVKRNERVFRLVACGLLPALGLLMFVLSTGGL